MYARSTTVRGDPQSVDDGIVFVRDEVMPAVQQMDGCVGLSMLADRGSGRCIVTTAWADADAMRRSAEGVTAMRQRAAALLGGDVDVKEWEIAVLHRMHESRDGACTRVIWSQGDPGVMDRAIDEFRMAMISRIEELPGFFSVSMLVDREKGRMATAVNYDNRDMMTRAQEQGMALRHEFNSRMGLEATEVAEFDLVLAHLRVPETV
jgi:heme-degrading monooxygenase HmoA